MRESTVNVLEFRVGYFLLNSCYFVSFRILFLLQFRLEMVIDIGDWVEQKMGETKHRRKIYSKLLAKRSVCARL